MGTRKYEVVQDGEWVEPIRRGYKLRCCDCELIHTINFRVVKGRIQLQAFRDYRATAAARRRKRAR